jgi:hypothetical protein
MPGFPETGVATDVVPSVPAHLSNHFLISGVVCMSRFTYTRREFTILLASPLSENLNHVFFDSTLSRVHPEPFRWHAYESDLSRSMCDFIGDWAVTKIKFFQVEKPENSANATSVAELPRSTSTTSNFRKQSNRVPWAATGNGFG